MTVNGRVGEWRRSRLWTTHTWKDGWSTQPWLSRYSGDIYNAWGVQPTSLSALPLPTLLTALSPGPFLRLLSHFAFEEKYKLAYKRAFLACTIIGERQISFAIVKIALSESPDLAAKPKPTLQRTNSRAPASTEENAQKKKNDRVVTPRRDRL